jgi:hypothetical protein
MTVLRKWHQSILCNSCLSPARQATAGEDAVVSTGSVN